MNCVNSSLDTNPITNVTQAKNKHNQPLNTYSHEIEILWKNLKEITCQSSAISRIRESEFSLCCQTFTSTAHAHPHPQISYFD